MISTKDDFDYPTPDFFYINNVFFFFILQLTKNLFDNYIVTYYFI